MILTLALRNLLHDRVRLAATLAGASFAVMLVGVQLGLYIGASRQITAMVDHTPAALWLMPQGTESFEDGLPLLENGLRHQALAVPGVVRADPLVVSFADWTRPDGAQASVVVVGTDRTPGGLSPWALAAGSAQAIEEPAAVIVDTSYLDDLGLGGIGDRRGAIDGTSVRVAALSHGIRSFTQSPYLFASTSFARRLLQAPPESASFYVVDLAPGADVRATKAALQTRLGSTEVLTSAEMRERCLDRWLMGTGAGVALIGGLLLGIIIGIVIVAQTIYSSTNEHLMEFATLRAIGSPRHYLGGIVLSQALATACAGFLVGIVLVGLAVWASHDTPLPLVLTPQAAFGLLAITVAIGIAASSGAILKVSRTDPGIVFNR